MIRSTIGALAIAAFGMLSTPAISADTETAIFAGGCFWCVESDFDHVDGVISTTSGYIDGRGENPTYYDHSSRGWREAVKIEFDPSKVSYMQLVDSFFRSIDPTDTGGQFCDRGHSYTTAVYTTSDSQTKTANMAKESAQSELGREVVTPVAVAGKFYDAEDYHQDYHNKNPLRYKYYRYACGRDKRVKALWGAAARRGLGS